MVWNVWRGLLGGVTSSPGTRVGHRGKGVVPFPPSFPENYKGVLFVLREPTSLVKAFRDLVEVAM